MNSHLKTWHEIIFNQNKAKLSSILAEEVIFYSPIVHSPQVGKQLTLMYLSAAFEVLARRFLGPEVGSVQHMDWK